MSKIKIGFVGVGTISGIYLKNIRDMFAEIEVAGLCDLVKERAENAAKEYNIAKVYKDMHELFADPEVDIVLNITRPYEHYEVTKAALSAGKHVYTEKPLSPDLNEARELAALAREKGLVLGGAPDTFMGAGIQTCRKLIDDGFIGTPVGASACMVTHGPEHWHPSPEFVYQYGGGPMLDMGPYYITALANLLGKIERVTGMAKISFPQRPILSQPKYGAVMDVDVPTYVTGVMQFAGGAVGTLFTTFDVYTDAHTRIEIYGSEGTLIVPDPNTFGGPVKLLRGAQDRFENIPLLFEYTGNCRALGLADMAKAIQTGRTHRANDNQLLHVVEVMDGIIKSGGSGRHIDIVSDFERESPMVSQSLKGIID